MPSALFHFGEFEIDCARFELRRNGRVVKLEHIPMELLILLAEKDGSVVSPRRLPPGSTERLGLRRVRDLDGCTAGLGL